MSDIANLLREAASGNPQIDISLRNRLESASESLGEPFLTILAPDPFDERSGAYMSMQDLDKLERLPPGSKLFLAPAQPAVPEWKPIDSYDAMRTKPKALFYVAAEPNATRPYLNLSAAISTDRHMGSRTITHWMPLPEPPAGDKP